ncbi:hypothetical protein A1Q2_03956 [Trichosporon asahii var. asahii CBS 8904]|uniref:Fumarylacetoacetase-like C-terminal domain-containing protein n=1 Tax=Trichosporon asahii var. asahii (strain CBS 8904) TaxID=1220162 RepID=K1WK88_TRIAC|nr:hypothetical protein A1Q2_03956 [Trichosporon asahii var. asahii CBS 8904]
MALPLNFMTIHLLDNHIDMPSIRNGHPGPASHDIRSNSVNGVSVTNLPVIGNGVPPPVGVATPPNTLLIHHISHVLYYPINISASGVSKRMLTPQSSQSYPSGGHVSSHPFTRLIRFISSGREMWGEPVDQSLDVGMAYAKNVPIYAHVLSGHSPWTLQGRTGQVVQVDELLSPISPNQAGTVRAIGLSYVDHARELNQPLPSAPSVFFKPPTTIANPGEAIPVPRCAQHDEVDYEVELAVVLGRDCKNVAPDDAIDFILGWTCANDLTARRVQETSSQWGYSKGFDKFLPLGPCLVSTALLPDPRDLVLETRLNGEVVQNGSARNMIWPVSELISHLSQGTTLPAGTVIITGTPPGIGASRGVWLRDGDEVRCSISGGIAQPHIEPKPESPLRC